MRNQLGLNVHIVPLGFEYERAVAPFERRNVDKVILVINDDKDELKAKKQEEYTYKVRQYLEQRNITVDVKKTDTFNLGESIRVYSQIIREEKERGNFVSINISSSGRFSSVAASISGMAHNIDVYYVHASDYAKSTEQLENQGVSSCDLKDPEVTKLNNFQFKLPTEEEAYILECLYVKKSKTNSPWVSPSEIGGILHTIYPSQYPWKPLPEGKKASSYFTGETRVSDIENYRTMQSKFLIKFQKSIGKNLEDGHYIERKGNERKHVYYQITPSGEYALFLYGLSNKISAEKDKIVYKPT
ncbi:MAG: hypothetical protein E7Z71_00995 [Methanocorpusculum parvum]|nr:hypothetical protein [Methanocorpusculum parvum]